MVEFSESSPALPKRFVSLEYNLPLFFEFALRGNSEFFDALQNEFRVGGALTMLSSNYFSPLKKLEYQADWGKGILQIYEQLFSEGDYHGVCVVDEKERWIIAQNLDISMGVALFKGADPDAVSLFEQFRVSDWFFGIDFVKEALNDPFSGLVRDYGEDFLRLLLKNYSVVGDTSEWTV